MLPSSFRIGRGPVLDDVVVEDAVVLADGRVLVVGRAASGPRTKILAVLDTALRGWTIVVKPAALSAASPLGAVALTQDGAVFTDAALGPRRTGLRWDATRNVWTEIAPVEPNPASELLGATATVLRDGRVLVVGGLKNGPNGKTTNEVRLSSKDGSTFEAIAPLKRARFEHTATLLADGRVLVVGGKSSPGPSGALVFAEIFDPTTGAWSDAHRFSGEGRHGHTATELADGRVLVAGGTTPNGVFANLEVWDPRSNQWSVVGPMYEPRAHHTATLLENGNVVFIGGHTTSEHAIGYDSGHVRLVNGESAVTVEVFDPKSNHITPTAHIDTGRFDHRTVLLHDGRLLVLGGTQGERAKAVEPIEIWDRVASEPPPAIVVDLPSARLRQPTAALPDGRIFAPADALIWNPTENTTVPATELPSEIAVPTALLAAVGNEGVLAVDEDHAALFTGRDWKKLASPARRNQSTRAFYGCSDETTVTPLVDGALVIGGALYVGDAARGQALFRGHGAERWSIRDRKFVSAGRLGTPRTRHSATLLADGRVLVTGGQGEPPPDTVVAVCDRSGPALKATELWVPAKKAFVGSGSMTEARVDHAAVRLADGRVLVTGGRDARPSRTAEIWSPATSKWESVASMKNARIAHTATLLSDGRVLVIGGDETSVPSVAEIYDPTKNEWSTHGPLPELFLGHQALLLANDRVLVTTSHRSLVLSVSATKH